MRNLDAQSQERVPTSAVEAAWLVAGKLKKDMHFENEKLVSGK